MEDEEEDDDLSALALRGTPPPWGGTSPDPAIAPALQQNLRTALLPPTPQQGGPYVLTP